MNVDLEMPLRDDWTTLFSNNPKLELTFGTSWIWEHKSRDFAVMILIIKIVPLKIFCFFFDSAWSAAAHTISRFSFEFLRV